MENRKGVRYRKPPLVEALCEFRFEPIIVQPPKKRVLASMRVRLLPKDFRRRLPKPVISSRPEVEP